MQWTTRALENLPELVLFLTVGLGYALGKVRLGKYSLGTIMAVLLVGMAVGYATQLQPSRELRWAFFLMFLFANGYVVGPQFARSLKSGASKSLVLSFVIVATALGLTYACANVLGLDAGMAAGLFSGAMTSAPAMGTAMDAIRALDVPSDVQEALASRISLANALTYFGGAIGILVFVSTLAPWLLRVELRKEAARLESQFGISRENAEVVSAYQKFGVRAFRVERPELAGSRVADVEGHVPGARYFVERIGRDGRILDARADEILHAGDVAVIYGRTDALLRLEAHLGPEVHDPALMGFPMRTVRVVVTNPGIMAQPLAALVSSPQFDFRSVGVRSIGRGGIEVPVGPASTLDRGDVLELTGPQRAVERAIADVGYELVPTTATNLTVVSIGIVFGTLAGLGSMTVGRTELTLGVSVGVLAAGLLCGWRHAARPTFGNLPEPAARLMIDLGLAAFVAAAGLEAGPQLIEAVGSVGVSLVASGIVVTTAPPLAALLVGHYVLRMNPILLLGGIAGAQTFTAALAALQEKSGSAVAVVGYTVPYAASNVLLTACGALVVTLVA